jgi:hypothetical protein
MLLFEANLTALRPTGEDPNAKSTFIYALSLPNACLPTTLLAHAHTTILNRLYLAPARGGGSACAALDELAKGECLERSTLPPIPNPSRLERSSPTPSSTETTTTESSVELQALMRLSGNPLQRSSLPVPKQFLSISSAFESLENLAPLASAMALNAAMHSYYHLAHPQTSVANEEAVNNGTSNFFFLFFLILQIILSDNPCPSPGGQLLWSSWLFCLPFVWRWIRIRLWCAPP